MVSHSSPKLIVDTQEPYPELVPNFSSAMPLENELQIRRNRTKNSYRTLAQPCLSKMNCRYVETVPLNWYRSYAQPFLLKMSCRYVETVPLNWIGDSYPDTPLKNMLQIRRNRTPELVSIIWSAIPLENELQIRRNRTQNSYLTLAQPCLSKMNCRYVGTVPRTRTELQLSHACRK